MKKAICRIIQLLLPLMLLVTAHAATVHVGFFKVAGTNDVMPGSGKHFDKFGIPTYNDGRIVFSGAASVFVSGLYNDIPGYVQLVADNRTHVPLNKSHYFTNFFNDNALAGLPGMQNGQIIFYARSGSVNGLYRLHKNGLDLIADNRTLMPGSHLMLEHLSHPFLLANDEVVFLGSSAQFYGVFSADKAGKLHVLMNANSTTIPQGKGNFTSLQSMAFASGGQDTGYAIIGAGSHGQMGVYVSQQFALKRIADRNTKMPGGVGFFSHFSNLDYAAGKTGFIGDGVLGEEGVYVAGSKGLQTVATTSTLVPEANGTFSHFDGFAMNHDWVVFASDSQLGGDGIYLYVPAYGLFKLLASGDTINGKKVAKITIGPKSLVSNHLAMRITFQDKSVGVYIATLTVKPY